MTNRVFREETVRPGGTACRWQRTTRTLKHAPAAQWLGDAVSHRRGARGRSAEDREVPPGLANPRPVAASETPAPPRSQSGGGRPESPGEIAWLATRHLPLQSCVRSARRARSVDAPAGWSVAPGGEDGTGWSSAAGWRPLLGTF